MKIFVCVKQVPDTTGKVTVKKDGTIDRRAMAAIVNPDDLHAVEAALRIKESAGAQVIAVTMGPDAAVQMLHELTAMGIDKTVLISAKELGGSDTFGTSQTLAAVIAKIGVEPGDMILCGQQAIDGDTAQVGPQLAEKLGLPQVTNVVGLRLDKGCVLCEKRTEAEDLLIRVKTPCVLMCRKELNTPRYMTVRGILHCDDAPMLRYDYAALKELPMFDADVVGLQNAPTTILTAYAPPQKAAGEFLSGGSREMAQQLCAQLREEQGI